MTEISAIISQIRTVATIFQNRVGGAAEFATIDTAGLLATPSCYVLPGKQSAEENESQNGLYQRVTEEFSIIVMFSNSIGVADGDRRGQTTVSQYPEVVKRQICKSILNWQPNNPHENPEVPADPTTENHGIRGFYYIGGDLREFDNARLFYEYRFGIESYITDQVDGWDLDGPPLEEINMRITNASHGQGEKPDTLAVVDIQIDPNVTINLVGVAAGSSSGSAV
jgi:hypothetical protein